jgi:hypothetical protein
MGSLAVIGDFDAGLAGSAVGSRLFDVRRRHCVDCGLEGSVSDWAGIGWVFRWVGAQFDRVWGNDAVLPFPLRASLDRVDNQLDQLIYQAFPQTKAS